VPKSGDFGYEGMGMYDKQQLMGLFRERALKFGDFTLASGKKAKYYLDGKQVTLHSRGLRQVSLGLLELLRGVEFDAVGGMSIGADPIVAGVLTVAAEQGRDLKGFLVRKESKGHGTQKYVEGPLEPGERVVIVEDVVTTGGSSLLAIDRVQEFGGKVVQVVAIVDRMEGGAAQFAARDVPFRSLLTIEDFGITPPTL
jgi:orotate phosphoribosyltransferase